MKSENYVDEQTIEYTHTIVPASMRSSYWKYFGFPSDSANKILTRQKIICTLCGTAITYNKNTSNLRTHLIARHPEKLLEMHQEQQNNSALPSRMSYDNDGISTQISNINKGSQIINKNKRLVHTNQNVESVIKIRRINAGRHRINNITSKHEVLSDGDDKEIHSDDLKFCLKEYHCQSVKTETQRIVKPNDSNGEDEPIVVDTSTYVFLGSEPVNGLQSSAEEHLDPDCNDDNIDNDVDELIDNDTGILDAEIVEKQMFRYAPDMSPSPREQINNLSNILDNTASHVELLADMLVKDVLPFNVLQGIGFKQLLYSFGIANFDKYAVEKRIQTDFSKMQYVIKKYITTHLRQQDKPYSLSIETYANNEEENIFSVYVNIINLETDYKLESILYDEIICNNETELYNILQDFDLSRCAAIVTTKADNLIIKNFCTTHSIEPVPCLDALLTRCANLIFKQDLVYELFRKIRKLCPNSIVTIPNLNCPWAKLKLLQDFLDVPSPADNHNINSEMSSVLESFIAYVKPLKITLDTINTEPLPLCTLVRPLMVKLFEEHFLVFNTDGNIYIQAAQKVINAELRNSIEKCPFFSKAVLFDGRFQHDFILPVRQLTDRDKEQKNSLHGYHRSEIEAAVWQRFQNIIINPSFDIKTEQKDKCKPQQIVPQSSLRLFFHRISGAASAANVTNSSKIFPKVSQPKNPFDLECRKYKCEPALDLEQCPLHWWQSQSKQYEILYKIAKYYLSVPCYAVPWQIRTNSEVQMEDRSLWQQKRKALRYEHPVERYLWYLHYNRFLYDRVKPTSPL
ncbi:uncharacterized protein [Eurosta solidaginis]|uniref:uncharacterized protein n=1 Tax=Eurosta solidaginis TaxID=178769 RepID=UPI003530CE09